MTSREGAASRGSEARRVALAFAAFFLLLCSYYILRPVRDEMAVQSGSARLTWLFTGTFVVTLAVVPLFGWVARRVPRPRLLPMVYGFLVLNLAGFYVAFLGGAGLVTAATFFIWLSFFNLFVISLFWSRLADAFSREESHRLYGYIAAGGTAGAMAGPALTALLAKTAGIANLIALSGVLLLLAAGCMVALARDARPDARDPQPLGGSVLAGIGLTFRVPDLRGIAVIVACYTVVSTFLYVEIVDHARATYATPGDRTAFFAQLDLAVNTIALLVQLAGTRAIVRRFGLRTALAIVPLVVTAGLAALAAWRTLAMLAALQTVHRAGEFALAKPGREMVYTVVDPEGRYKAKNFIDTAVHRGGDAASAWYLAALKGASLDPLLFAAAPAAIGWLAANFIVGRRHDRHDTT